MLLVFLLIAHELVWSTSDEEKNSILQGYKSGLLAHEQGDYESAWKDLMPVAEKGVADAQFKIGFMYANGQGVTQNYKEAVKWYLKSAEQGLPQGQHFLGGMYFLGQGVPQDYKEAVKWYRKAAEQGFAVAQSNLGIMYVVGHGVPQDIVQAHKWFNIAGANGFEEGIKHRDSIAQSMTPEQVTEAQRLASVWMEKHP